MNKKQILLKIINDVRELRDNGELSIKKIQTASYVYQKLRNRNIQFNAGHFFNLFAEDEKRSYEDEM